MNKIVFWMAIFLAAIAVVCNLLVFEPKRSFPGAPVRIELGPTIGTTAPPTSTEIAPFPGFRPAVGAADAECLVIDSLKVIKAACASGTCDTGPGGIGS